MRTIGARAYGIRLPIISRGDDLVSIIAERMAETLRSEGIGLEAGDVLGVTEAVVAKSQGNYAQIDDIAADVRNKFGEGAHVGFAFPGISRNRYLHILKGIARGAGELTVLLRYPADEVGNPVMDMDAYDNVTDSCDDPIPAKLFTEKAGAFKHPFTGIDYISLYGSAGDNIKVYLSRDPRDILKFTDNVVVGDIHSRFVTKARLAKAGARNIFTLSDILASPVNGSGYNEDYGVLGSNILTDVNIKLFPRDCAAFLDRLKSALTAKAGMAPEMLVYGDGAFKDPVAGIWELMDPVVSPAYTERLGGVPDELKLKFLADSVVGGLSADEKQRVVTEMIRGKDTVDANLRLGTTPRKYADLLGSLCDLMSGSGDKGTPVVLIKGYFDNYAD